MAKKKPKAKKKTPKRKPARAVKKPINKKKPLRKTPVRPKPAPKKKPVRQTTKEPEKVVITPEIRRIWLRLRQAWNTSIPAFDYRLSMLNDKEANALYGIVRFSARYPSYVAIRKEHPELRELLRAEEDRRCMYEIYKHLSWRLNRKEELPAERKVFRGMRGTLGRSVPDFNTNF